METLNHLQNFPSQKRFEENMKFVYKVILKKLREKFARENGYELWDKQFERAFYEYYFEETRKILNEEIELFYDPLNQKLSKSKTLNNSYLRLIL